MKDEVLVIEDGVLKKCTDNSITSVVIPDSVKKIGVRAFEYCYNLESVEIPPSVKKIGERAFARCESLSSVVIPSSVKEIVKETFNGCELLESLVIPSSVTKIGEGAFAWCKSLESVEIPPSVTKICKEAFNGCKSLSSVEIPPSVTKIGKEAFKNCNISELSHPLLTIKNGVAIKDNQVLYCTSQSSSITIPDGVTEIGEGAFRWCESLESVEIPSSVKKIGSYAFNGCKSLSSVEIPPSVTKIGDGAFYGCKSLALQNAKDENPDQERTEDKKFDREWTEDEKLSFIETDYSEDCEGYKWVLLYVKNGYEYGMREAMYEMRGDDYGFGKEVVAVFNTKEGALQYYLDNKLYEKAYNDILESNDLENAFEDYVYDDNGEVSLDDIRSYLGDCAGNGDAWKNFYYELVSVEAIEK